MNISYDARNELVQDCSPIDRPKCIRAANIVRALRGIASDFRRASADPLHFFHLQSRAGELIIEAHRLDALPSIAELQGLISWHTADSTNDPVAGRDRQAVMVRCPGNLFIDICGNNLLPVFYDGQTFEVRGDPYGGLLPRVTPGTALLSKHELASLACEWLATEIEDKSQKVFRTPTNDEARWSAPMSKAEIARRVTGDYKARSRKIDGLLESWGIQHVKGHQWRLRLDRMDDATRERLERPR